MAGAPISAATGLPVGVWYGTQATQATILPTAGQLIQICRVNNIKKMLLCCDTLHDAQDILGYINSLKDTKIQAVLYVPAPEVRKIAQHRGGDWIQLIAECQPVISYVCLGNVGEININEIDVIGTAMDIINSIDSINPIKVSTLVDVNLILAPYKPRNPPSGSRIDERYRDLFKKLVQYSSPLLVKTFPNFAIGDDIGLDNYLLDQNALYYMTDRSMKYKYVFDAMVDSISCAIEALGFSNVDISVVSGWPTAGSREATLRNAQKYNNNLLRHVNEDTPRKTRRIDHFIFSMVDEEKLTPEWQHFGTFTVWEKKTFPPTIMDDSAEAP